MEIIWFFKIVKVKKFKNLEILQSKERFFQFSSGNNLLPYWNFLHIFCTENTTGKQKIKPSWVNSKASSFRTKLGKNENYFLLEHFLLISLCTNFWKMPSAWIFLHKLHAGNTTANWTIKQAYSLSKTLILSPKIEVKTKKYQTLEVFSNGIQLELFNTIPILEILSRKKD